MDDLIKDLFAGLQTYFAAKLTGVDVKVGFRDERLENADNRVYPAVTITWFNAITDSASRYSGVEHFTEINEDEETATITRKPIPIDLYFQLDAYAEKRSDDFSMTQILLPLIGCGTLQIETPLEYVQPIIPFTMDTLDRIEDGLFRKSYSFYTPVFFPHPDAATQAYLALKGICNINGTQVITVEA